MRKTKTNAKIKTNKTAKNNKTIKNYSKGNNNYSREYILIYCLEILNTIKIYHWKTHEYSNHKATDELYSELNEKIDTFIEVLIGKNGKRITINQKSMKVNDFDNSNKFKIYIENIKKYFINMTTSKNINVSNDSDLLSIRDEILETLNKFTYLLTLK